MAVLKQGSSGPDVTNLQQRLKALGFDSGSIDGKFGNGTRNAVIAFQKSKGLNPDGMVGPSTQAALAADSGDPNETPTLIIPTDPPDPGTGRLLTEKDFQDAAALIKCDVPAIKAVAEVESAGNGFLSDGRVKILFEGHLFYKYTNGAYAQSNPTICYKKWTKQFYSKGPNADVRGSGELARLAEAVALDRTAALKSASYGKFQILGFNHKVCGYDNVEDFYAAMQTNEGAQLKAFCGFVTGNSLDGALRKHSWAAFAKGYNGPAYAENKYDQKLAAAYKKYSG